MPVYAYIYIYIYIYINLALRLIVSHVTDFAIVYR